MQPVAVFGAGRAGCALARSLVEAGVSVCALGYRRRRPRDLPPSVDVVRGLPAVLRRAEAARARALFLAVPDDAIGSVAARVANAAWVPALVAHLSGARGPEALEGLPTKVGRGSFHPLASLAADRPIPPGTLLAVQATRRRDATWLLDLARRVRTEPAELAPGSSAAYHLGASLAANLPVALVAWATDLLVEAGVPRPLALQALTALLRSTVENLEARADPGAALTGAVARGDVGTVGLHLEVLTARGDPALLAAYRLLSERLVDLSGAPPSRRAALRKRLRGVAREDASLPEARRRRGSGAISRSRPRRPPTGRSS